MKPWELSAEELHVILRAIEGGLVADIEAWYDVDPPKGNAAAFERFSALVGRHVEFLPMSAGGAAWQADGWREIAGADWHGGGA